MNNDKLTTIIVADDHPLLIEGVRTMIKKFKHLQLLHEAHNGEELMEAVQKLKPSLVITGLRMPLMTGVEAIRHIKIKYPAIKIIALSNYDESDFMIEAIDAGADGFMLKNSGPGELIDAIRSVQSGRQFFCSSSSPKILALCNKQSKTENIIVLTGRERDLLRLYGRGLSTKQVAEELGLSIRTVETHRARLKEKLQLKNSTEIAIYALKHGYN